MSNVEKQLMRVKKAHITLMKHPETALYSGVMLMGRSDVSEGSFTAYTDGVNKRYCANYLETHKDESIIRGVVLHENLHVALKHIPRSREMFKEHTRMANMAVDFVVNDIMMNIKGTVQGTQEAIVKVHDTWIYDPMFHNWSVKEVWDYLKKNAKKAPPPPPQGQGNPCDNPTSKGDGKDSPPDKPRPQYESVEVGGKEYDLSDDGSGNGDFDEHDWESFIEGLTPDELKDLGKKIDDGLRQGGILAGRMGGKIPRAITDMLEPKIDWREALRDFVSSSKRGNDEFTWRKMNKRQLANDMYMPSMEDERMGEVIFGIDTSGSIMGETLNLFASELASACDLVSPEALRVLWWDTQVAGEQVFVDDYANFDTKLEPKGGGGTTIGCVSKHILKKGYSAECIVILTDGYTETDIVWDTTIPTLFVVVNGNKNFNPPTGKVLIVDEL